MLLAGALHVFSFYDLCSALAEFHGSVEPIISWPTPIQGKTVQVRSQVGEDVTSLPKQRISVSQSNNNPLSV